MDSKAPDSIAKLCEVCSRLDIQRLTRPFYPCRDPLPCSTPPIGNSYANFIPLGSMDEIKSRRFICDICKLVAESLDKEPPSLDGKCVLRESAEFCNFKLPENVKVRDPSITHFHLTQVSVVFDTTMASQFHGPSLPWDLKTKDEQSSHFILNFQVKARSCAGAGDSTAVSPQTEQEFLDTIGGRRVATQVNAKLIRAWLHQCESKHGKDCMPSSQLPGERGREPIFQPTFVVDVTQSCLVATPSRCRYVALSYVWGRAPVFRHLLENTQDLRKTGSLRSLPIPTTIRDAIALVHAIGERFIWVDSICIIQDDLKMQQTEITRMGSIYSNALFAIIAAAGDHANSGLPGVEGESRGQTQKILKLADSELLTVIDVHKPQCKLDSTIWASRAWTFQERVLSNRVLVFSENQVYWSCHAASHSEERALEDIRDIDRVHISFSQNIHTDCLSWEHLQPPEYRDIYYDLLYGYRQRRLSYQTDILNAFNGVSEILSRLQNDTFLWGLPESLFSYAMTWFSTGRFVRNRVRVPVFGSSGSKETVGIPSWSWAAWSGDDPNSLLVFHAGYGSHVRPVIEFDIVDGNHQLVRVKERSWKHRPGDHILTSWKEHSPSQALIQSHPIPQIGQLRFWTSHANLRAIRRRRAKGPGEVQYTLFPPLDFQPDPAATHYHTELVHQDFIVIAASGPETLILLAIEWKDDVAYRVGSTDVKEADWVRVESRQWRLITLG